MPKEKNQHKSAAASDEKFRDFFTTTVADIPAEMVRREEEAAEEHKGLFGRLFGHAKPKQAPQAGTDLELPTGEVLLGADALAKPDGEEPLDLDLTLRTADPGTDFPQPKAEVPAAPEKPAVPDKPAPQPAPENKPEPPKAPAAPAPQPEKPRKKAAQKAEMERTSFTVTELNAHIKQLLDADMLLGNVCVTGELSNYKAYPSGHHYLTLKDAESSLRCVMFRSSAQSLRFRPASGMSVAAVGRIAVYPRDGAYQLYCTRLIPGGVGDLYAAYEQLKEQLQKEGLFDRAHKKPLPQFPQRIAVITSSAGAAVRDIIRVLGKRWPASEVVLLPVRVQGVEAPAEIAGAIRYANRYHVGDLIITGRGGGSIEDLWAFNDERVARAIYDSDIPVISAVGHEPDVTISDFVADLRAATPSNAAELAVPNAEDLRETLRSYDVRMTQAMRKQMTQRRAALENLAGRRVLQSPAAYFDLRRVELDYTRSRLIAAGERYLVSRRQAFAQCAAALDAMSPLKVLGRGYAVASDAAGTVLRSAGQVQPGDAIRVQLQDGALHCTVNNREEAHGKTETDL